MFGAKRPAEIVCGFDKKPCRQSGCQFWVSLQGKDPQGGDTLGAGCAVLANLTVQMANNRLLIGVQADTESMRNEVVRAVTGMQVALVGAIESMLATLRGVESSMAKAVTDSRKERDING